MKKSEKILLFIVSLIGLGFAIGQLSLFYPIPQVTDGIRSYQSFSPWLNDVFAGYSAFICLCFFLLLLVALVSPNRSSDLTLVKSKGELRFSKQTIESTVRYSFADVEGVNSSRVRARIHRQPEKLRIYIKLSLSDAGKMVDLTESVQGKIEASLKSSLGIAAKSINIKVAEFNPDHKNQKENSGNAVHSSRVV